MVAKYNLLVQMYFSGEIIVYSIEAYIFPGSVYTVVAVALERYFNICKPFSRNLVSVALVYN